nr:MAG TPA: hypothetical protein [Caudoviricetes sp.]
MLGIKSPSSVSSVTASSMGPCSRDRSIRSATMALVVLLYMVFLSFLCSRLCGKFRENLLQRGKRLGRAVYPLSGKGRVEALDVDHGTDPALLLLVEFVHVVIPALDVDKCLRVEGPALWRGQNYHSITSSSRYAASGPSYSGLDSGALVRHNEGGNRA